MSVRVYKFLSKKYALDNLAKHRIKISEYCDVNDPFELSGVALSDRNVQQSIQKSILSTGALCFSRSWRNPLLWSHYADKHRGICLGFDVSSTVEVHEPRYVENLSVLDHRYVLEAAAQQNTLAANDPLFQDAQRVMMALLLTKFEGWRYEDEIRIWALLKPDQKYDNLYFAELDADILPNIVILGPRCSLTTGEREAITTSIRGYSVSIPIVQAMLSPTSFEVLEDPSGPKESTES